MAAISQKGSLAHLATDPLRNFRFHVQVNHPKFPGFAKLGFMSVSGLSITTEVIPYREGGMNTTTQKMPGQSDFAPVTLSKGMAVGETYMMDWMKELFYVMQGEGTRAATTLDFRHTVDIWVMDHPVTLGNVPVKAHFQLKNAWPTAIAFSDLDAGANAVMINQMTLAHEGFTFEMAKQLGADSL